MNANISKMTTKEIIKRLENNGLTILNNSRVNNCGNKLEISNGAIVNVYDKGTFNVQGKNTEYVNNLLVTDNKLCNKKVFVVYGHDHIARTQLEAMLRRWDLEPIILEQIVSSGSTIIEKLEEYTSQAGFGIVLATPDDMGYAKSDNKKIFKSRVRQNVVLELGMLLSSIGRDKVAILLKEEPDFERPSDIDGLIYIPFKNNVEESKVSLAKEMNRHNYRIEISKL